MRCPREIDLQSYHDEELNAFQRRRIANHLQRCPACRQKTEQLQWLTGMLHEVMAPVALPRFCPKPRYLRLNKAAAAVLAVMLGLAGWWYSQSFRMEGQPSRDGELMEQYFMLHAAEGSGGTNV